MSSILVLLNEPDLSRDVAAYLAANGFSAERVLNPAELTAALWRNAADLVILDAQLPDGTSLAVCRRLAEGEGPLVILMGLGQDEIERIVGLEVGAEDYVCKSVNLRELLARVRVALRRRIPTASAGESPRAYASRGLELDVVHRHLKAPGREPLRLTPAEVSVLAAFIEREGEPVSRADLKGVIFQGGKTVMDGAIDTQISRLRRKLTSYAGVELIQTIHGVGYVWNAVFGPSRIGTPAPAVPPANPRKIRVV